MAQRDPEIRYGVSSIIALDRVTGLPFGNARVIGEASFNLGGEVNKLFGGDSQFPWAANPSALDGSIGLTLKEFPAWLTELFMGIKPTETLTPNTTGEITKVLTNKKGTSTVAATGIVTVDLRAAEEAKVRFASYIVKVVSATTVDVFGVEDVDYARGGDGPDFQDNLLKITASPLTIVTATTTEIPGTGIDLTGGGGTIAMTIDDTAEFETLPTFIEKTTVTVGPGKLTFPEFKLIIIGERQGATGLYKLEIFKTIGVGLPRTYAEKAFNETEIAAAALNDSALGVYKETALR